MIPEVFPKIYIPPGWPNAGTKDIFQMMVASGRKWRPCGVLPEKARQLEAKCLELRRKIRIFLADQLSDVKLIKWSVCPLRFNWFQVFTCSSYSYDIHIQLISCIYIYIYHIILYILYITHISCLFLVPKPGQRTAATQGKAQAQAEGVASSQIDLGFPMDFHSHGMSWGVPP